MKRYRQKQKKDNADDNAVITSEENRIDKNRKEESKRKYLLKIPPSDKKEFLERFNLTEKQLLSKAESLNDYCLSKGRIYKNYKAFLRNALKKDFEERERKPYFNDKLLSKDGDEYYYLNPKGGKMVKIFVDLKKIIWK